MHSAGLELMNLTYTRLEDNLIRDRSLSILLHDYHSIRRKLRIHIRQPRPVSYTVVTFL